MAVKITSFEEKDTSTYIAADIYCEKERHKAIILGHNGDKIKKLSTMSRQSIERLLDTRVYLDLYVKVKPNWRVDNLMLEEFGYVNKNY